MSAPAPKSEPSLADCIDRWVADAEREDEAPREDETEPEEPPEPVPFVPEWPDHDPRFLGNELPPPPALPLDDVLSPRWAAWVRSAAASASAPPDYVFAALLTVCGSLVGNARWAAPWSAWAEPPIIWAVAIGNPSAGKSPGVAAVTGPLARAERALREKAQAEVNDWRERAEVAKVVEATWKEAVKKAILVGDAPPVRPAGASPGPEPAMPRLSVADATIERLAVLVAAQPRGTLLVRDELAGWLHGMTRYAGGGGSDRPFWLEAYGGRAYSVERMGREPVYVDRLTVGVLGSIQPDRLRSLLLKSDDDGLFARLLPVWPDPVPPRRPSAPHDTAFLDAVLARLLSLDMPADEDGRPCPWFVPFTDDARNLLDAFRQQVSEWEAGTEGLHLSFVGKLPGLVVRLSLVLAMMEWAGGEGSEPREITTCHLGRAAHLVESYILPMARRAYADAAFNPGERAARRLVALIRERGWKTFTAREVRRMQRTGLSSMDEINPALAALVTADLIHEIDVPASPAGGRRQRLYTVNPVVLGAPS